MGSKKKAETLKTTRTGQLLRTSREKLDLSQRAVAKALGFSSVFLSRIEFGKCDLPTKYVERASSVLKIPKDDIEFTIKHDLSERIDRKLHR